MFNTNFYKRKEFGFVLCAIGLGIILGIILPPIGWMIGCALGLIATGYMLSKKC